MVPSRNGYDCSDFKSQERKIKTVVKINDFGSNHKGIRVMVDSASELKRSLPKCTMINDCIVSIKNQ